MSITEYIRAKHAAINAEEFFPSFRVFWRDAAPPGLDMGDSRPGNTEQARQIYLGKVPANPVGPDRIIFATHAIHSSRHIPMLQHVAHFGVKILKVAP